MEQNGSEGGGARDSIHQHLKPLIPGTAFFQELGKAGIPYNTYAHMATGIWSSENTTGPCPAGGNIPNEVALTLPLDYRLLQAAEGLSPGLSTRKPRSATGTAAHSQTMGADPSPRPCGSQPCRLRRILLVQDSLQLRWPLRAMRHSLMAEPPCPLMGSVAAAGWCTAGSTQRCGPSLGRTSTCTAALCLRLLDRCITFECAARILSDQVPAHSKDNLAS